LVQGEAKAVKPRQLHISSQRIPRLQIRKWFTVSLGVKRWVLVFSIGLILIAVGIALLFNHIELFSVSNPVPRDLWWIDLIITALGIALVYLAIGRALGIILSPYQKLHRGQFIDVVMENNRLDKGLRFVAIGGGTGLPSSLRGMKKYTRNITAIVTVADDGGSSGRLRRDLGVPPPGDLRNNIAALADENSVLTRLFQYRFSGGDLQGHSFGNLFIAALADIVQEPDDRRNSLAEALVEVERVLNIRGRVLPSTLDDVTLSAEMWLEGSARPIKVIGESQIGTLAGSIETIYLHPENASAYEPSVQAILDADIIVLGPGSLYTSILPNLLIKGIADALRATDAYKIYVCNVATQPVETEGYTVAEHVMALERHIGRGVFQAVLANSKYPQKNAGENTRYVLPAHSNHEVMQRYEIHYTDLTDEERPWRHDPDKLATAILELSKLNFAVSPFITSTGVSS
jgi:uncharacterized cofD-like protein